MSTFNINIITPTNTFSIDDVEYLRAPSTEGLFGVKYGHISSIIALDIGEVKVTHSGNITRFATSGGYADISQDGVALILETAENADEIDCKRAEESINRSTKNLSDNAKDISRAQQSIKRAKNRIKVFNSSN